MKSDFQRSQNTVKRGLCDIYEKEILSDISKGVSPVKGERFPKYSQTYKEQIRSGRFDFLNKSIAPVNLNLSGVMIGSFFAKPTQKGVEMGFTDKVAEYHNDEGAGKSKVLRRLLPTNEGEEFNSSIELKVQSLLDNLPNL